MFQVSKHCVITVEIVLPQVPLYLGTDGVGQLYTSATLPGKGAIGIHRTGGWVGPRASLDAVVNKKIRSSC